MQDYRYSNEAEKQDKNPTENKFAEAADYIADAVGDFVIGVSKFALTIVGIAAFAVGVESLEDWLEI